MINLINSVRTLMRSVFPITIDTLWHADPPYSVPLIFINLLVVTWAIAFS